MSKEGITCRHQRQRARQASRGKCADSTQDQRRNTYSAVKTRHVKRSKNLNAGDLSSEKGKSLMESKISATTLATIRTAVRTSKRDAHGCSLTSASKNSQTRLRNLRFQAGCWRQGLQDVGGRGLPAPDTNECCSRTLCSLFEPPLLIMEVRRSDCAGRTSNTSSSATSARPAPRSAEDASDSSATHCCECSAWYECSAR
mmetsp:Transcript_100931/g.323976  ORF Transcript_100931/g.323976 Transcript_100931/m.323976 type:complete len:200 (+) Transcript_100931:751-1350(+)